MNKAGIPLAPFENIERLVTVEMRPHNMIHGHIGAFYNRVRGSDSPLTHRIAADLLRVRPKRVAIATGIVFGEHLPHGEIDGPIGSVVLAKALEDLGVHVDLLVEDEMANLMKRLTSRLSLDAGIRSTTGRSEAEITKWADDYDAAVAIEKLGRGADGLRHSIMATPLPPGDSYVDALFEALLKTNKLTIGIGDGGNEIGFGNIYEDVVRLVPKGNEMATVTKTKYLFPAAVSNFGAYALCGALALHTQSPSSMVDPDTVVNLLRDAVAEGCLDGGTVDPEFVGDDGIPALGVAAVITLLNTIVSQWFSKFDRHF